MSNWNELFTRDNYRNVKAEQIIEYVQSEKPEYLDEIKTAVENGISFLVIKKDFYKKYFPNEAPKDPDPNKKTMRDLLNMEKKPKPRKNSKKK